MELFGIIILTILGYVLYGVFEALAKLRHLIVPIIVILVTCTISFIFWYIIFQRPRKKELEKAHKKSEYEEHLSFWAQEISENPVTIEEELGELYDETTTPSNATCKEWNDYIAQHRHKFVSVHFYHSDESYDYLCDDINHIKKDDIVYIPTPYGTQAVKVTKVFCLDEDNLDKPLFKYEKVIGKKC